MTYPDNCVKGIPNKNLIDEDGLPQTGLFQFHENEQRNDLWSETSVNWEDDDTVVSFTLSQRRNDELHFRAGVARINRADIDRLVTRIEDRFSYERAPLDGNQYHGNLLLHKNATKNTKRVVMANLALHSVVIPRQD